MAILSTLLGIDADLGAETYYLAALVLPYLIFDSSKKNMILLSAALAPAGWSVQQAVSLESVSNFWILRDFPYTGIVRSVNFLGSSFIISIFLSSYSRSSSRHRRTQEALSKISMDLDEAQSAARIGTWSFDVSNEQVNWSKQMFEIFDAEGSLQSPSLQGQLSKIHPEDRPLWAKTIDDCLRDGKPYRIRIRAQLPSKTLWIEAIGRGKQNATGKVVMLSGTCQDVSDLIHAEEIAKLERSKAIQNSKLASLGELAAGVAHEINNPLAIISGTIQLLPDYVSSPDKLLQKISTIDRATQRIAKIVLGLKKFSRSSEKSVYRPTKLKDILLESLTLTESKAKRHAVPVELESSSDPIIHCDEIEVEQVIIILINNGIDAVKNTPSRWLKLILTEEEQTVVLRCMDSGSGINREVASKLFQPFFTTKAVGQGTGLGLSIAKGILQDHGASIELIENHPHTCFEIRFPKPKGEANANIS